MDKHRQEALALLARETSPAKRRTLIEELTQVFREPPSGGQREIHQVGEALAKLLPSLPVPERVRIAERVASAKYAPTYLIHQLAIDAPEVASPVIAESPVLTEAQLSEFAEKGDSLRLAAIGRRAAVAETLQASIIKSGDAHAIVALLANRTVSLSPATIASALAFASRDETIADQLIARPDTPIASFIDLFFKIGAKPQLRLLRALAERGTGTSRPVLEDAEARFLEAVRSGERQQLLAALRRAFHLQPQLVESALDDETCLGLAVVAVGAGLSRAAYSTFVVLSHDPASWPAALLLFERVPTAGARRLLAHWQAPEALPAKLETSPPADSVGRAGPGPGRKGPQKDSRNDKRRR